MSNVTDKSKQVDETLSKPTFDQWLLDYFEMSEEEMQAWWEDYQKKELEKMQLYAQLFNNNSHRYAMTNASILYHARDNDVKEKQNED